MKAGVSFARFDYGYNTVSAARYAKRDNARGDAFTYDGIDQVIGVQYDALTPDTTPSAPLRTESFAYDSAGNRQTATESGVTQAYSVDSSNRYIQVGSATIGSDANGNLTTGLGGFTYSYDAEARLKTSNGPGGVVTLTYDGLKRCVARTINGATTFYYYDDWNLTEERNSSGTLLRRYVHGVDTDELLVMVRSSGASYYHQDRLGSTIKLSNSLGNVEESYVYDAYGASTLRDGAGNIVGASQVGNRFLFTGRELRSEMGLYDYRNRGYAPGIGRFVQSDPISFEAGNQNLYRYVGNQAPNATDPTGLEILLETHLVTIGLHHAKITIIPCDQERWKNHPKFQRNRLPDGRVYAAIGAGPESFAPPLGRLVGAVNRPTDLDRGGNSSSVALPISPDEENAYIKALFHQESGYRDNLKYAIIPLPGNQRYNSNSFIAGLLIAVGSAPQKPRVAVPGYKKPVPTTHFTNPPLPW